MADTLRIIKESEGVFWHVHNNDDATKFSISDFEISFDGNVFKIVEIDGSKRYNYLVQNITVLDKTGTGTIESFPNAFELQKKLIEIQYTPFSGGNSGSGSLSGKEDKSNKVSVIIGNETSETLYPNTKAIGDYGIFLIDFAKGLDAVLQNQINTINDVLQSDNFNLDTLQEIVDTIEDIEPYLASKLTGTVATNPEMQITAPVAEDNKMASRSTLYNWWEWVRANALNISGKLTINNNNIIVKAPAIGTYPYSSVSNDAIHNFANGTNYLRVGYQRLFWSIEGFTVIFQTTTPTQNNDLKLPNKSGTLAVINDSVVTAAGTATTPSFIIPNGTLTTVPQNGAIERDSSGKLWQTINNVRTELVPTRFSKNLYNFNSSLLFNRANSIAGDVILMSTIAGSGKVYPATNDTTKFSTGDIIDTTFLLYQTNPNPNVTNLTLSFKIYSTNAGSVTVLVNTYNYAWDLVAHPTLNVEIIFTRGNYNATYGYVEGYSILINGVFFAGFSSVFNLYTADIRMELTNNNAGSNSVSISSRKSVNLYIPVS